MCDSNQPFPIPLPGKGGDITFFIKETGDVPGGRTTFSSDNPHGRAKVMNGSGRTRRARAGGKI